MSSLTFSKAIHWTGLEVFWSQFWPPGHMFDTLTRFQPCSFHAEISPDSRKSQILLVILVFPVFFKKYTFMKCFIQITCNDFHHKQS